MTLHPTFICTSFFHTAFGRGGSSKIGATGDITLRHVSCASVLSGCSPTVAEQQSSSALMACCHKATALPDMPAAADHQLHVMDVQCMSSHGHGDMDQPGTSSAPAAYLPFSVSVHPAVLTAQLLTVSTDCQIKKVAVNRNGRETSQELA